MDTNNNRTRKTIELLGNFFCVTLVKRILCIVLLAFEVDRDKICSGLGLSVKSLKKYESMLDSDEYALLLHMGEHKRRSELEDYKEEIFKELDGGAYHTLRQIAVMIKEKTGVERSRNRIQVFLRENGYKPLKVGFFPLEGKWGKAEGVLPENP